MFNNFYKKSFNWFGNISPQKKDTEVAFVQKVCLIQPALKYFEKVLKVVKLEFDFDFVENTKDQKQILKQITSQ